MTPLDHDHRFFAALTAADTAALDTLLAPDFLLVAVDSGAVVTKDELVAAVAGGAVTFPEIVPVPAEAVVRRFGDVAVVVGRTRMSFTGPDGTPFTAGSRYTHVFTAAGDGWRLVSAQGTTIADGPVEAG